MPDQRQLDLQFDAYRLEERISRRARSIRIEVISPTDVRLIIPHTIARREGQAFLLSRDAWVREKLAEMRLRYAAEARRPSPRLKWDGTDTIPLRGRKVQVGVVATRVRKASVRVSDDCIELFAAPSTRTPRSKYLQMLRDALRNEARIDASRMLADEARRLGVDYSGPRIADQKTLWGSCTAENRISLSWRLVMAPREVFRYVVIHELCHVRHHNHSKRFWGLVAKQMPDFEAHRRWLGEHGASLHWWLPN